MQSDLEIEDSSENNSNKINKVSIDNVTLQPPNITLAKMEGRGRKGRHAMLKQSET